MKLCSKFGWIMKNSIGYGQFFPRGKISQAISPLGENILGNCSPGGKISQAIHPRGEKYPRQLFLQGEKYPRQLLPRGKNIPGTSSLGGEISQAIVPPGDKYPRQLFSQGKNILGNYAQKTLCLRQFWPGGQFCQGAISACYTRQFWNRM